jgi:hypothetical protein
MTDLATTESDRSTLATEYVAGGVGLWSRTALRTLPSAIDDITQDFGDDLYDRMDLDPVVHASKNVLKTAIIEEGLRLAPPLDDPDADGYEMAGEIRDFCESVLSDLQIPLDDVLFDLLDAIQTGSKLAEEVYQAVPATSYALPGSSPISRTQDMLILSALKPKPRNATAFVVDAYMNIQCIAAARPGMGSIPQGLYAMPLRSPNVLSRDKFAILTFRPKDADPRGTSAFRPAYFPWFAKQQVWDEFLKYLAQFASPSIYAIASEASTKHGIDVDNGDGTKTNTPAGQVLRDTLLDFRNGTAMGLPYGTLVNTLEVAGDGQAFHNAFLHCDQQITIAILHQTRATMEAEHGSRADSETGQDILGTIQRQAKRAVCTMFKRDILRPLVSYNYGPDASRMLTPNANLGSVEKQDFNAFALAIAALAKVGYLDPSQYAAIDAQLNLPARAAPPEPTAAAAADDDQDEEDQEADGGT